MISRILEDAEKKASEMRAAAEAEQATRISAAQKWAEELLTSSRKALADEADATVERRETVARLDGRKKVLGAKRELIDEVFARALEKAQNFPKARYAEIVSRLWKRTPRRAIPSYCPVSRRSVKAKPRRCPSFARANCVSAAQTAHSRADCFFPTKRAIRIFLSRRSSPPTAFRWNPTSWKFYFPTGAKRSKE